MIFPDALFARFLALGSVAPRRRQKSWRASARMKCLLNIEYRNGALSAATRLRTICAQNTTFRLPLGLWPNLQSAEAGRRWSTTVGFRTTRWTAWMLGR